MNTVFERYIRIKPKAIIEGLKSLRVSRFRTIYRTSHEKYIEIVAIGPRKIIYEETFRILIKEKTIQG